MWLSEREAVQGERDQSLSPCPGADRPGASQYRRHRNTNAVYKAAEVGSAERVDCSAKAEMERRGSVLECSGT